MGRGRSIAFVTGTRADYGIARWILQDIADDPDLTLQLIVTGSHLDGSLGHTVDEIVNDGFDIDRRVPIDVSDDSPTGTAQWMAECLTGLTTALVELAPDILLIVGDRFEALVAAQAALIAQVPVGHIHGGELTEGSLDDGMRHAITKLAHVHFAAAPEYGRRIVQLGEHPTTVHVVGSPGLCALVRDSSVPADELEAALGFPPSEPFVIVTYHPATAQAASESVSGAQAMVEALARFPDLRVVVTGVNVDPGFAALREVFVQFATANPDRVTVVETLGHRRYLAALASAQACVGNSSSGIIEAPALGVPTVNIGDRQRGRLRAHTVIDASPDSESIAFALTRVLSPDFGRSSDSVSLPDGSGGASRRIYEIVREADLTGLRQKAFRDCGPGCDSWSALDGMTVDG